MSYREHTREFDLWSEGWEDSGNGVFRSEVYGRRRGTQQLPYWSATVRAIPALGKLDIEVDVPPPLYQAALRIIEDLILDLRAATAEKWHENPKLPMGDIAWAPRAKARLRKPRLGPVRSRRAPDDRGDQGSSAQTGVV